MNLEVLWDVLIQTAEGKEWQLGIMSECSIDKSVKNLAGTAKLIFPETQMNKVIDFEEKIRRGDKIKISLGYKDLIHTAEFEGYIREIVANGGNLNIECEDALFLFRKDVKNKEFKMTSLRSIAQYLIDEIGENINLECDYGITYEKFTIYKATAYDVLKKLKEETSADIYFENNTLHIHPAYTRKKGEVDYSPQYNIENFSLEWKQAIDKKVEVTIEKVGLDGKVESYTTGNPGGDKITKKVSSLDSKSIKMIADNEYKQRMTDGYEGSFDAWLFPFVEPSFTVGIYDEDYPNRNSRYYVDSVKTEMSLSGVSRKVQIGIKLSE